MLSVVDTHSAAIEIAVNAPHRPLNLSAQRGVPRVTTRFTGWRLLAKELAIRGGFGGARG